MKKIAYLSAILLVLAAASAGISSAAERKIAIAGAAREDISLKKEVEHAIGKGLDWLKPRQDKAGFWSQEQYPALTGLVLTSFMREPSGEYKRSQPEFIKQGYEYMLKMVKPDGGIYGKDLATYNTSVSIMALLTAGNTVYEPVLKQARNFLVGQQQNINDPKNPDSLFDGGIGYGNTYNHSDMSNMLFALEAIYYTRHLNNDKGKDVTFKELDWKNAIRFIQRCQNLPGSNDQVWATGDPQNKGGFIYFPGDSKAGEMTLHSDGKALRSYGSISYAGLLSYIYADLDRNDSRVQAVYEWLRRNYTLDENPGMGKDGLFYYYHTMAKALALYGASEIKLANGQSVNWRRHLALRLLDLQQGDGSWVNENGRWWEKDPVLVTTYVLICLEIVYQGL